MKSSARREEGFAIIIVLLVLLALLVMCTPFLLASRNADRASSELADRSSARLALDSAARHARANLSGTHPSQDKTPFWDSLEEIRVDNRFDAQFLDANDPHGVMWDLQVDDVAGKIDLNSASPQVIANMIGASARFADVIGKDAKKIPLSQSSGFMPSGFLWSGGELIRYGKLVEGELKDFQRGVLAAAGEKEWRGGPSPPTDHDNGAPVLDQRAFAPVLWRLNSGDADIRTFAAVEELRQAKDYVLAAALNEDGSPSSKSAGGAAANPGSGSAAANPSGASANANGDTTSASGATGGTIVEGWGEETLRALSNYGSVFGSARGGHMWQHAARVTSAVEGRKDGRFTVDNVRWFNPGSTIQITDGQSTELALVTLVRKDGLVVLDRVLANDYAAFAAQVRVLARRPVNINTAPPEVLKILFTNLQIMGRNSRITKDRAQQLAELVVQSRPFTGHEDFLRRVVLPAGGLEKLPTDAEVHPDILASGSGFIDAYEALALYTNGLNANDASLVYSTMPYCYTTRDTYAIECRASVNAPSGVERFSIVRDEVDVVTPQTQLFALWSRQDDFDEAMRLDCEAPWWMSAPSATSRWDQGASPPSRLWAHMGTYAGKTFLPGVTDTSGMQDKESQPTAEHVFASREKDGWIQLWPSRTDEMGQREGRVMHFDQETRDPEGRYLPDEPIARSTDDKQVVWSGKNGLMLPMSFSLWVKPRSLSDATILDVMSGIDQRADRVSLLLEQGDLVLRVLDGVGDHPQTSEKEVGEVRFQLAAGKGPGLPAEIWSHVAVDVRGNQPHQMSMQVNGLDHGVRTLGLTRLTGGVSPNTSILPVESVEGFPPYCTVRLGNELVEVAVSGGGLKTTRQDTGQYAGFGGRVAREQEKPSQSNATVWVPNGTGEGNTGSQSATTPDGVMMTTHPAGTPVELYGYSLPIKSDVPTGRAQLSADLGGFRVAQLKGVVGSPVPGEQISLPGYQDTPGWGMKGKNSQVTGLVLTSADAPNSANVDFMTAFHTTGGYAAIVQTNWTYAGTTSVPARDADGTPLGGIEVIRYSGYTGTTLQIAARGDAVPELTDLSTQNLKPQEAALIGGRRDFISFWNSLATTNGIPWQNLLDRRAYVIPISLAVPGAGNVNGFLAAKAGSSRFAQLTHLQDAENTEWVRYDWFEPGQGQLVRDDPVALIRTLVTVKYGYSTNGDPNAPPNLPPPPPPGQSPNGSGSNGNGSNGGGSNGNFSNGNNSNGDGSGGGNSNGGSSGGGSNGLSSLAMTDASDGSSASGGDPSDSGVGAPAVIAFATPPALASVNATQPLVSQADTSQWQPTIGRSDTVGTPLAPFSDAISAALQFRGVFGTYSHKQPSGTVILPVFMTAYSTMDAGRPGRLDVAFLVGANLDHPGWPVRVHRAHIPGSWVPNYAWKQDTASLQNQNPQPLVAALAPAQARLAQDQYLLDNLMVYVALQDKSPELMVHGGLTQNAANPIYDTRALARLVAFPSGERPRAVSRMSVGGGATGAQAGVVPAAVVDEVVFGDARKFRAAATDVETSTGASLILVSELGEAGTSALFDRKVARIAIGHTGTDQPILSDLRKDGGLLRIGDEILAYNARDPDSGNITLAPNGRGLLGTRPQPHHITEPVMYLEHYTVTSLTGEVGASDAMLPVASTEEFPKEGTVLIGTELIHYTHLRDARLEMPRASSVPGAMDAKGGGLFRGRYGTSPAAHSSGEAVILFPFRYWDRWAERADAPELSYFTLSIDQPAAFWESFFFDKTDTDAGNVGVLQRTVSDAPWDADPEKDKRVQLFWKGDVQGQPIPIGVQSNAIEWRVFVKYAPNAFDMKTGLPQGWKQTPRLRHLGAFYYAPNVVLRSSER